MRKFMIKRYFATVLALAGILAATGCQSVQSAQSSESSKSSPKQESSATEAASDTEQTEDASDTEQAESAEADNAVQTEKTANTLPIYSPGTSDFKFYDLAGNEVDIDYVNCYKISYLLWQGEDGAYNKIESGDKINGLSVYGTYSVYWLNTLYPQLINCSECGYSLENAEDSLAGIELDGIAEYDGSNWQLHIIMDEGDEEFPDIRVEKRYDTDFMTEAEIDGEAVSLQPIAIRLGDSGGLLSGLDTSKAYRVNITVGDITYTAGPQQYEGDNACLLSASAGVDALTSSAEL